MEFKPLTDFLDRNKKVIICAHESPDGDAIGTEYGLLQALKAMGIEARVINNDPTPSNFLFIDQTREISYIKGPKDVPADIEEYALIIVDTNDTNNIGKISTLILPKVKEYFIIDHHDYGPDAVHGNLIYKEASSAAEIIYQFIAKMKIPIDINMANALYMAIVYDTGSFIYPKTSPITLQIAHELVKMGVNPNFIYTQVYETDSIPSLILQSRVIGTLELKLNNRVAIQTMTKEMLDETGADYDEGRTFINIPLKANKILVSVFFKQNSKGVYRCSLRSKGDIDVCEISREYGGGGHKNAAGFKFDVSLEDMRKKLLNKLSKYFKNRES
jgi:bifunctional oligoribonuclease and PAP phosphatase NrnA